MKISIYIFLVLVANIVYAQKKQPDEISKLLSSKVESDVDTVAEFPLGQKAMFQYLHKKFKKSKCLIKKGEKLYFSCLLNEDGFVDKVSLINKNISRNNRICSCKIVKSMPRWRPAYYRGKKIQSSFIIPLYF